MTPTSPKKRSREPERCAHRRTRSKLSSEVSTTPSHPTSMPLRTPKDSTVDEDAATDSESELSESSEEPSSESSSDEDSEQDSDDEGHFSNSDPLGSPDAADVINVRANRGEKPVMKLSKDELGPDIRDFLKDFLPQLKAANDELEAERKAGTLKSREIETQGEEGQYIEMDLGLGVLEERDPNATEDSSESDSEADQQQDGVDLMGKLLGREKNTEKAHIEELDNSDKK